MKLVSLDNRLRSCENSARCSTGDFNMRLSNEELARLEQMFASGLVQSDPLTLSATDRMLEDVIRGACTKAAPPSYPANASTVPQNSDAPSEAQSSWKTPRTLDELIRIRQTLLRDKARDL